MEKIEAKNISENYWMGLVNLIQTMSSMDQRIQASIKLVCATAL